MLCKRASKKKKDEETKEEELNYLEFGKQKLGGGRILAHLAVDLAKRLRFFFGWGSNAREKKKKKEEREVI